MDLVELKINSDGTKFWYCNNMLHRVDGPACDYYNGDKEWWFNGKLHRIDGPAIECTNGEKRWYVANKQYSEEDYNKIIKIGLWIL